MTPAQLLLETLRLRHSLDPEQLYAEWVAADTRGLARLVLNEGCAVWLHRRLKDLDVASTDVPWRPFNAWLSRQARHITARNAVVAGHAPEVVRFFSDAGVPCVLIKGVARFCASDTYPLADAREISGIDMLAPYADARGVWRTIRSSGYDNVADVSHNPAILPALVNEADVPIEIHTATVHFETVEETWQRTFPNALHAEIAGAKVLVPCATDLLWQSLAHVFHHGEDAFRLRYFHDAASVLAAEREVDWDEILARLDPASPSTRAVAVAWLGAAAWLAGAPLATDISMGVRPFDISRMTHWRLAVGRRLDPSGRVAQALIRQGTLIESGWVRDSKGPPPMGGVGQAVADGLGRAGYVAWKLGGGHRRTPTRGPARAPSATTGNEM